MAKDRKHPNYGKPSKTPRLAKRQPSMPVGTYMICGGGPSPMELSPAHGRLLGCIVAELSAIEHSLAIVLAAVVGYKDMGIVHVLLASAPTGQARLNLMRSLFRDNRRSKEEAKGVGLLLNKVEELMQKRNEYAHAHYGITESRKIVIFDMKRLLSDLPSARILPLKELRDLYADMRAMTSTIAEAYGDLLDLCGIPYSKLPPKFLEPVLQRQRRRQAKRTVRSGRAQPTPPQS